MGFPEPSGDVIVLGYFDGVHTGHVRLLETASEIAFRCGGKVSVRTFSDDRTDAISPGSLRKDLLIRFGADIVIADRFADVRDFSPEEFVEFAVGPSDFVVCGFNYSFGKGRSGDSATLSRIVGAERVSVVPPVTYDGDRVSSSLIRALLADGNIKRAIGMLGHPFIIRGEVIHGKHLGKKLGFPTANVALNGCFLPNGAYAGYCFIYGKVYPTVTGITSCPTTGTEILHSETHIIGFDGDLYGNTCDFMITSRIREEKNYLSTGALSRRISDDIKISEDLFGKTEAFFNLKK